MPIRPEFRKFYQGPEWKAARARILARANHCCEKCGVPNHQTVLRQYGWWTEPSLEATVWAHGGRFNYRDGTISQNGALIETAGDVQFIHLPWRSSRNAATRLPCFPNTGEHRWVYIVLTIAHLNNTPGDDRDENLKALCQYDHLTMDARFHKQTRSIRKDGARPLLQEATA